MSELFDAFSEFFEVRPARTPQEVESTFRLRYRVYCIEKGFERPELCVGRMERDGFDDWSVHGLIRQRRTGNTVASLRLVQASRLPAGIRLPIEEHCGRAFYPEFTVEGIPASCIAEISRFAVLPEFRRRKGEAETVHGLTDEAVQEGPNEDERRAAPHLTLGLFRATLELSVEAGVTHWYAVMEPTLVRLLQRCGVNFERIGDDLDYHGLRRPCFVGIAAMLARMKRERPDIWGFMTEDGTLWPEGDG